jgi:hypothetical protein
MFWICPICDKKVDFSKQLSEVFEEDGEASFDPKGGLYFHTISCKCGCNWIMSISGVEK